MKRVLNVGQCGADHGAIGHLLSRQFEAEVTAADDADTALSQLSSGSYDLVLVNRRLDLDGSDGLEVIRRIKADQALAATPVMLVTNFPEYQQQAIALGAEPGFGKAHLADAETRGLLEKFLG